MAPQQNVRHEIVVWIFVMSLLTVMAVVSVKFSRKQKTQSTEQILKESYDQPGTVTVIGQ